MSAQKNTGKDIWSGTYLVNEINNGVSKTTDTLVVAKVKDADPDKIPAKEKSDLARWSMISKKDENKDEITVKRFLFDIKKDKDAYKEFGWTELHKAGKMNCIDGGHFFICQTQPGTQVAFGKEETYLPKPVFLGYGCIMALLNCKKKNLK